jgi:GTP-binding protein
LFLQKAIELNLKPIVVVNKVDKPNCDPEAAQEAVFELMFSLDATEEQLDFPTVYGSAKAGWMSGHWNDEREDVSHLLDVILEHIPPTPTLEGSLQLQISSIDFSSYVGRIAVGRVRRGEINWGDQVSLVKKDGTITKSKVKELYVFEGLGKEKIKKPVQSGEICAVLGIEDFDIGDTIADFENPEGLKSISVDEPTMSMLFTINNSPFYGRDGQYLTSRHLKERLEKEIERNLALRVEETDAAETFMVYGRGILHLSILIETMRREGYELQLGQPKVIFKTIDGKKHEPIESLTVNVPDQFSGKVIEQVNMRKGELLSMESKNDRVNLIFDIPARGLIGLRNRVLTATEGEAIMAHRFKEYQPFKGEIPNRKSGSLIAMESGNTFAYALDKLQDRGKFFVGPGEEVYAGMVVGENNKEDDLGVKVTKSKKLTNMRASGSDDKMKIAPPIRFSLEEALEYIKDDEYLEVTPKTYRMRKILLSEVERKRAGK